MPAWINHISCRFVFFVFLKTTSLEDHRTAQKAFLEIMYSNPLLSQSQLLRVMSTLVVNISKDADPTPSLGNLCNYLFAVTGKKNVFLTFRWNFLISVSACPIASCPITGHSWEEPSSFCFDPSTRHLYTLIRFLLGFFFSGLNRTTSLSLYSCAKCFELLNYLGDPSMHLNSCMSLSLLQESPQTREPRTGHRTPDDVFSLALNRGERSSPFHLLAELFLMHPRMLLAFFAARLHCWLIVNLLTRVPWLFSPELLSGLSSRCASAWDDFAFPLVELHGFPIGSFLEPIKCSPEWQHNHPVCQPVLPVMFHLWICWISFQSHQWEDYMVLVPLSTNSHWSWLVTSDWLWAADHISFEPSASASFQITSLSHIFNPYITRLFCEDVKKKQCQKSY